MFPYKNQGLAHAKPAFTIGKRLEIGPMLSFIAALLLLGISLLGISMRKTYYYLPPKELKRQAEAGDKLARTLWRAVAYDTSLGALLWLWIGLSSAGGFVLLAKLAPWYIALVATALLLWIAFAWFPRRSRLTGLEARLSMWVTPVVVWLLNYLHPVLDRTIGVIGRRYPHSPHTDVYEAADMVELLQRQKEQVDNRISPEQLDALERSLTAHQYKIGDVLTPRKDVKTVKDNDTVGLLLLDELHKSNQTIFPVVKSGADKIIGSLYLEDLNLKTEGKVRDYMQHDIRYLHEDDSLVQALQAFFKTKHQLFVVVNSFEEYVGIVTLEHVIQQLTGQTYEADFDQHHDLAAVANKHVHDDEPEVSEAEAEPDEVAVPEPDDTEPLGHEDTGFEELAELDEPAEVSTPETEVVTAEEVDEPGADKSVANDEGKEETVNPEDLAALDLPEENEEDNPANHITFDDPKHPGKKKTT